METNKEKLGVYCSHNEKLNGPIYEAVNISNEKEYLVWLEKSAINPSRFEFPTTIIIKIKKEDRYYKGNLLNIKRINEINKEEILAERQHRPKSWIKIDSIEYKNFKSILYIQGLKKISQPKEVKGKPSPERPTYFGFYENKYAVIVQNDESKWDDIKGDLYHYPSIYKNILIPKCKIIYFKGKMRKRVFKPHRLSPDPHYFGIGIIGDSIEDPDSEKGDLYCEILYYQEFEEAVPIKINGNYFEDIPASKESNYWRFGVREISKKIYDKIIAYAKIKEYEISLPNEHNELESFDIVDGKKKDRYSSYYERNPFYRNKAIELHGLLCMTCRFNFQKVYGELGKGFIHVHHNKPISESGPTKINPGTDLSVLCPNCHAMVHRNKKHTLSLNELKEMMKINSLQPTG